MTVLFYEKHVPADPLLAPLFANSPPDQPRRLALWFAEVLGGPALYSEHRGGYQQVAAAHAGASFTEERRAARDRQSMSFAFDLWSRSDVTAHAADILQRLQDGSMPCDGAWALQKVEVFKRWTESGSQP